MNFAPARSLPALGLIAAVFALAVDAYDKKDLQHLETFRECSKCDLSGANLGYIELKNTTLDGSNLRGANLEGADFYSASLQNVDLTDATLVSANLNTTVLKGARFKGANLYRANMLGANLTGADLAGAINLGTNTVNEAMLCHTRLDSGVVDRDCIK